MNKAAVAGLYVALFAACAGMSVVDFYSFHWNKDVAFITHNIAGLACGVSLMWFPYRLIKAGSGNAKFHFMVILIGFWQLLAHIVKLYFGHCI